MVKDRVGEASPPLSAGRTVTLEMDPRLALGVPNQTGWRPVVTLLAGWLPAVVVLVAVAVGAFAGAPSVVKWVFLAVAALFASLSAMSTVGFVVERWVIRRITSDMDPATANLLREQADRIHSWLPKSGASLVHESQPSSGWVDDMQAFGSEAAAKELRKVMVVHAAPNWPPSAFLALLSGDRVVETTGSQKIDAGQMDEVASAARESGWDVLRWFGKGWERSWKASEKGRTA